MSAAETLLNDEGEVVVPLADGWSLRSGVYDANAPGARISGEYVRLCRPDGSEYQYWDSEEWKADPTLVMGAIMNAAAGLRMAEEAQDAMSLTGVRKTVLQFTVLHEDDSTVADMTLESIGHECDVGAYIGGKLITVSDMRLTREQVETECRALGSDPEFFLDGDSEGEREGESQGQGG